MVATRPWLRRSASQAFGLPASTQTKARRPGPGQGVPGNPAFVRLYTDCAWRPTARTQRAQRYTVPDFPRVLRVSLCRRVRCEAPPRQNLVMREPCVGVVADVCGRCRGWQGASPVTRTRASQRGGIAIAQSAG